MRKILDLFLGCLASCRWKGKIDDVSSMFPTGRDTFKYTEGNHSMEIYAELTNGEIEREFALECVRGWDAPYEKEEITQEKRREILSKVCKCFETNGVSYHVQPYWLDK